MKENGDKNNLSNYNNENYLQDLQQEGCILEPQKDQNDLNRFNDEEGKFQEKVVSRSVDLCRYNSMSVQTKNENCENIYRTMKSNVANNDLKAFNTMTSNLPISNTMHSGHNNLNCKNCNPNFKNSNTYEPINTGHLNGVEDVYSNNYNQMFSTHANKKNAEYFNYDKFKKISKECVQYDDFSKSIFDSQIAEKNYKDHARAKIPSDLNNFSNFGRDSMVVSPKFEEELHQKKFDSCCHMFDDQKYEQVLTNNYFQLDAKKNDQSLQ